MNSKQVFGMGARPQSLDNGSATTQANERGRHGKAEFLVLVRAEQRERGSREGHPRYDQTQCGQHGCACMDRLAGRWCLHIQRSYKGRDLEEVDAESADAIGAINVSERPASGAGQITLGISGNEGSGVAELTRHGRTAARVRGSSHKASCSKAMFTRAFQLDAQATGPCVASHTRARVVGLAMGGLCGGLGLAGLGQLGPDQVPVVGAQVLAGDGAIGGALDGNAVRRAGAATCITVLPLTDLGVARHPRTLSQLANSECAWAR